MAEGYKLIYMERRIGSWGVPTLEFDHESRPTLCVDLTRTTVNATSNRTVQQPWKVAVASEVKAARGDAPWYPGDKYVVTLGISFHPENHGGPSSKFDVDNYIKPVLDAIAAGLFCSDHERVEEITDWDYDDSNFKTLLVHRLPDANDPGSEGIAICVSVKSNTT